MLTKLSVQNFRSLRDVKVSLSPLSMIVGPNASGKSSILEAIRIGLSALQTKQVNAVLGSLRQQATFDVKNSRMEIRLRGIHRWGDKEVDWTVELFEAGGDQKGFGFDPKTPNDEFRKQLAAEYEETAVFSFEPNHAKAITGNGVPVLKSNGAGVADFLKHIRLVDPDLMRQIEETLAIVVPQYSKIHFRHLNNDYRLEFETRDRRRIPAETAGDGTLMALAIICSVYSEASPKVVLIDEIERGLHPRALGDLVKSLREIIEERGTQIIATTHSPYLVDHLDASEVTLIDLDSEGLTRAQLLSEHPDFEKWKDMMHTGEFWSTVGEDWVVEGKTKA